MEEVFPSKEISSGFILCDLKDTCAVAKVFDAQVVILECPSIICPGFNAIMHIHTATVEVQLKVRFDEPVRPERGRNL